MKKKINLIIIILITLIVIDQIVKLCVINNLQEQSLEYSIMRLTYSKNTGIAFGMAKDSIFTIIITELVVISTIIVFLIRQLKNIDVKTSIVISMILAGGISNFIDRLLYGGVIDYLDIGKLIPNFPIFNIADCLIFLGLVIFVIFTFKEFSNLKNGKYIEEQRKRIEDEE